MLFKSHPRMLWINRKIQCQRTVVLLSKVLTVTYTHTRLYSVHRVVALTDSFIHTQM